jgi:phosphoglycolate phosphatase
MLRELRSRGYRIGVLTRGCREYAETALRIAGISDLLDAVVARDDHPEVEAKPSPIAMRHMAEAVGVRPDEITYV